MHKFVLEAYFGKPEPHEVDSSGKIYFCPNTDLFLEEKLGENCENFECKNTSKGVSFIHNF